MKTKIINMFDLFERKILKGNKLLLLPILVCVGLLYLSHNAEAKDFNIFEGKLSAERKVIGCYNKHTKTARSIFDTEETGCYKGGDFNIMVMPESHLPIWRELWNDREIVNRMPIITFESGFLECAGEKNCIGSRYNPYAKGYVQTLRKWNIPNDIKSQLQWMKNRQEVQKLEYTKGGSPRCGIYWSQYNYKDGFNAGEEGVMACLYRYHYHAHDGVWYSNKAMEARKIYFKYFNIK